MAVWRRALYILDAGRGTLCRDAWFEGGRMSEVVYTSRVRIERQKGPLRLAYLPGEAQPVTFSVHGAIARHYKVDPAAIGTSHAATLDYVIAATAG
jgi:hypothetical protein